MTQLALFPELCRPELCAGAKRLLGIIQSLHSIRGEVFPFQRTLARRLGVCVRTVKRWVRQLVDAGLLAVHRRGRTSALYSLHFVPSNVPSKPPASSYTERLPQRIVFDTNAPAIRRLPPPSAPTPAGERTWRQKISHALKMVDREQWIAKPLEADPVEKCIDAKLSGMQVSEESAWYALKKAVMLVNEDSHRHLRPKSWGWVLGVIGRAK